MVLAYNELIPVLVTGVICGLIACLERYKEHLKHVETEAEKAEEDSEGKKKTQKSYKHVLITDFVRNTLYATALAFGVFWLAGLATDDYQIKLGITGIVSILGLDRAVAIVEKFISLKKP